jgi:TonB family protein
MVEYYALHKKDNMKRITFTALILLLSSICQAQTVQTRYYNNQYLEEEVPQGKARYSQTVTQNADGSITTSKKNLKKDVVEFSQTLKGEEPFGVWIYQRASGLAEMDYNFQLQYTEEDCPGDGALVRIENYLENDDSKGYTAPKIAPEEKSILSFIGRNLVYPAKARREGIQGRVVLVFTITKEGAIEDIFVKKGVHMVLDKEAVRVLRKLKFSSPPRLNGQPQNFCVEMPVSFKLA